MRKPTIVEYSAPINKVFTALSQIIAERGYVIQNIDRGSGLITFYDPRQRVNCSSIVREIGIEKTQLTIAGASNSAAMLESAAVARTVFAINLVRSIGAPDRIARGIIDDMDEIFGVVGRIELEIGMKKSDEVVVNWMGRIIGTSIVVLLILFLFLEGCGG